MYSSTISCLASSRAFGSRVLDAPVLANESMSAHFEDEERPGAESHFLRRESLSVLSGRSWRRRSVFSGVAHGS